MQNIIARCKKNISSDTNLSLDEMVGGRVRLLVPVPRGDIAWHMKGALGGGGLRLDGRNSL